MGPPLLPPPLPLLFCTLLLAIGFPPASAVEAGAGECQGAAAGIHAGADMMRCYVGCLQAAPASG